MGAWVASSANPLGTLRRMRWLMRPGTVQRVLGRIDQDVDGGQLGHGLGSSVKVQSDRDQKMVVQSFFMLTTVQPCSAACVCDASAEAV